MTAEIRKREEALARLLTAFRLEGRPSAELLAAAADWSGTVWEEAKKAGPYPLDNADITQGLYLSRRPVFICGVHRSGTTLVRNLLDGHPQLCVLPSEGSFLTGLRAKLDRLLPAERPGFLGREWLRRLVNPTGQAPFWLLGRTTEEDSPYVTFARMLLAWWPLVESRLGPHTTLAPHIAVVLAYTSCFDGLGIGSAVKRWVEKTPTNEFYLNPLWAELPDAKMIHVIRHPYAVYASRKRLEERSFGTFSFVRRTLEDLARSLQIAAENVCRQDCRNYLLLRYEELTVKPQEVIECLADFLEIEPTPSLLCPTVANRPARPNSSFSEKEKAEGILPDAMDYHQSLTPAERELIAAYTGDFAGALGYTVESLKPGHKTLVKMKLRLRKGI
ncbi:MAG TPA: sulfotransferase [Chthonomonadales bacterium]|nr:sulfotransferase [Chthonomonadales bacterium]